MGTRQKRERQQGLWIAAGDVVETPGNAFYDRLNQILDQHKFDAKVERLCGKFYKKSPYGRPSMAPGVYFRSLLIGYFEGLDSERGIAWRSADSLIRKRLLRESSDVVIYRKTVIPLARNVRNFVVGTNRCAMRSCTT